MHEYVLKMLWAAGVALVVTLALGPIMIPFLARLKVGQSIREEGPQRHYKKAGTPTIGGIIIITAVMVASFILAGTSAEALSAVLVMLAFGGIGFWDDYIKVVLKRSLGLRARDKLAWQLLIAILYWLLLEFYLGRGSAIIVPFTGSQIDLGYIYLPFLIIVLLGTANGVNLTDGLDGLSSRSNLFCGGGLYFGGIDDRSL